MTKLAWRMYVVGLVVATICFIATAIELNRNPPASSYQFELFNRFNPGQWIIGISLYVGLFAKKPTKEANATNDELCKSA